MDEEKLLAKLQRLLQGLEDQGVRLPIDVCPSFAVVLVAQLQLALRHERNVGPSALMVQGFADSLIDRLDAMAPGIGAILRMGYDPAHDIQRGR